MNQKNQNHRQKLRPPHGRNAPRDSKTGKPDWQANKAMTLQMIDQIDAGNYTLDDVGQVDPDNGTNQDERALMKAMHSLKPNQSLMWFVRGDADPSDKGQPVAA